ncbi:MAG TPA: LLM class flavin-dependent oxidoreductase [Gaiellaceae bacterium]|jgi:alkanesulfonate monooxygenase SsuD/methylene tetrahydromethanopterin reductase-like flavin-dependent oxidoreductase (luciferase family)|nr:LLM class flavin-dependent oxidoreductase [Gaiellaceae bacterium]
MRYGLQLCTLGTYADPRETVRAAVAAEAAGWEALLVWDHLAWASRGAPSADPWVTLGACAAMTTRILLGTAVTPLPRRRPQMVAQQLASLSLASSGRVVFGAGSGVAEELERFGEDGGDRRRGSLLDEGLDVVSRLLAGERVEHHGEHYVVDGATLAPLPLRPIPIWIGGNSPAALRRAARWDGWLANSSDRERNVFTPGDISERTAGLELADVCFIGYAAQADLDAYEAAGVTWWIENVWGEPADVLARIAAGPAR